MAKRFKRSMEQAFKTLTVDGMAMSGLEALAYFEHLEQKRPKGEAWKKDLRHLMVDLVLMGGRSIEARTSGTTGPPKPIRIPRRDLVNSARLTAATFGLEEGDRVLLCLP
jgi:O-succinylbenzoic acid--CoA ligase